jgi:hypothetical protein
MAYSALFQYSFSSQIVEPPPTAQLRFDAATYAAVSKVWIPYTTSDGIDAYRALIAMVATAPLYVQDKNDHTLYVEFAVAAAVLDKGSYVEVPVTYVGTGGAALNNNQAVLAAIVSGDPTAIPPPDSGAVLVTLATAKAYVGITDTSRDATLQTVLNGAHAAIFDYLGEPDPVPTDSLIVACVLKQFAEMQRALGDDPESWTTKPQAIGELAQDITSLLYRRRPKTVV